MEKRNYKNRYILLNAFIVLSTVLYACKEKYFPSITDANPNYVVIEGFINTGGDSTIIKVSRTFRLDGRAVSTGEKGATVLVENDAGASFNLAEILLKPGTYAIPNIGTDQTKKYRVRVRTKDNKEYVSDFVESKTSPPIDKITFDGKNDNVNFYAFSHDDSGNSLYYNYSFVETWQYRASLNSTLKIENKEVKLRDYPQDDIYNCWHTAPSTNITLGSTVNLTRDVIADKLLTSIPVTSTKVQIGYSILVKQTVLTKEGFEFWENMRKNTEQVGSIFDSQPSQLFGNIHSTSNTAENVIGFISAGTVTQKRLTIFQTDVNFIPGPTDDSSCRSAMDSLYFNSAEGDQVKKYLTDPINSVYIVVTELRDPGGFISGYTAISTPLCADCRLQGGRNIKPDYW